MTETIKEFSRVLNKVLRFLVLSNVDEISVLVVPSELDGLSAGASTSRKLDVGFLR